MAESNTAPMGQELPPIERDEPMDRTYIPLPGGWEIQTKGKGSTFRLAHVPGRTRWMVLSDDLHEPLEAMARDTRNMIEQQAERIRHLERELEQSRAAFKGSENARRIAEQVAQAERGPAWTVPDYVSERNWQATPCEIFKGKLNSRGYGITSTGSAHKVAYVKAYGSVPEGLELDHLCRNPACVNPLHLEPVTPRENKIRSNGVTGINSRKTHCVRGHPLSGDNLVPGVKGRICIACRVERVIRYSKSGK